MDLFDIVVAKALAGGSGGGGGGGSSDFSTAEVTFHILGYDQDGGAGWTNIISLVNDNLYAYTEFGFPDGGKTTIVLYKGHARGLAGGMDFAVSGNATWDSETEEIDITGDCTISYTAWDGN